MNAPASVFEHNGQQYIAAYSAGNLFVGSPRGDSVWLFALNGEMSPALAPGTPAPVTLETTRDPDIESGRNVFAVTCAACHGPDGEGGHAGGIPLVNATLPAAIAQVVIEGRNLMPAMAGALTPEQIQDVAQFVADELPH